MPLMNVRFFDASRAPLNDQVDVDVTKLRTNEQFVRVRNHDGRRKLAIRGLDPGETYVVRVFPMRYRPVGQFAVTSRGSKSTDVDVYCPVHPQRVESVDFPEYPEAVAGVEGRARAQHAGARRRPAAARRGQPGRRPARPCTTA